MQRKEREKIDQKKFFFGFNKEITCVTKMWVPFNKGGSFSPLHWNSNSSTISESFTKPVKNSAEFAHKKTESAIILRRLQLFFYFLDDLGLKRRSYLFLDKGNK